MPITILERRCISDGWALFVQGKGRVGRNSGRVDALVKPNGEMRAECSENPEFCMNALVSLA